MHKKKTPAETKAHAPLGKLARQILRSLADEKVGRETHLGEERLAEQFRVSRTPVRAALKQLADHGLVEKRLNLGYFVIGDLGALGEDALLAEGPEESIYYRIVEDRLSGSLPEKISEQELMRRYGVTKTRLAALLRRMTQVGWIARLPGHGWEFLPVLVSEEAYDQGYQFRVLVEPAALLLDSYCLPPREIARLRAELETMLRVGLENYSSRETFQVGALFHEAIVAASGNPFYTDAIQRMNRLRRLLDYRARQDRLDLPRLVQAYHEHLELLNLIEAGRLKDASDFLRYHLERERRSKLPLIRLAHE